MGLFRSFASGGGAVVKTVGTAATLYGVAAVILVIAVVFALLAAFFAMAPHVGEIWAALIVAGVMLLLAIILVAVAATMLKKAKRRAAAFAAVAPAMALAGPVALGVAKRAPAVLVMALLAAGFVVARR